MSRDISELINRVPGSTGESEEDRKKYSEHMNKLLQEWQRRQIDEFHGMPRPNYPKGINQ